MPDPDLEIRGAGGWSSRPLDKGGGGGSLPKKFFQAFGPQFGKNNKGRAPLDPLLEYNFADVSLSMAGSPHAGESRFWNLGNFCLWNPESYALESRMHLTESGIPLMIGIQNPSSTE